MASHVAPRAQLERGRVLEAPARAHPVAGLAGPGGSPDELELQHALAGREEMVQRGCSRLRLRRAPRARLRPAPAPVARPGAAVAAAPAPARESTSTRQAPARARRPDARRATERLVCHLLLHGTPGTPEERARMVPRAQARIGPGKRWLGGRQPATRETGFARPKQDRQGSRSRPLRGWRQIRLPRQTSSQTLAPTSNR